MFILWIIKLNREYEKDNIIFARKVSNNHCLLTKIKDGGIGRSFYTILKLIVYLRRIDGKIGESVTRSIEVRPTVEG